MGDLRRVRAPNITREGGVEVQLLVLVRFLRGAGRVRASEPEERMSPVWGKGRAPPTLKGSASMLSSSRSSCWLLVKKIPGAYWYIGTTTTTTTIPWQEGGRPSAGGGVLSQREWSRALQLTHLRDCNTLHTKGQPKAGKQVSFGPFAQLSMFNTYGTCRAAARCMLKSEGVLDISDHASTFSHLRGSSRSTSPLLLGSLFPNTCTCTCNM